jgi:hypothetical protein
MTTPVPNSGAVTKNFPAIWELAFGRFAGGNARDGPKKPACQGTLKKRTSELRLLLQF